MNNTFFKDSNVVLSKKDNFSVQNSPHMFLCIDAKSFYASVECVIRGKDPLTTNLVVCDADRSENSICLAVSPSLKKLGISGRARYKEVLAWKDKVDYIVAKPRMERYLEYSANIYSLLLKYVAESDVHVYSVDESFLDVSNYLSLYKTTAYDLGLRIMNDIYDTLGLRTTCGVGTNLYLAKVALDIQSKHSPQYIGVLDEESYIKEMWDHKPLTDFWMIGPGKAKQLASIGIHSMRGIANMDEDVLYRMFGIDAELMIDHAWGREPTRMEHIKAYKTKSTSLTKGQTLMSDYSFEQAETVVKEVADMLCLEMVGREVATTSISLYIGYSMVYKMNGTGGTVSFNDATNSDLQIIPALIKLYRQTTIPGMSIRRVNISCNNLKNEEFHQYDLFTDTEALEKNRKMQKAVLEIKSKYGKNAILKGYDIYVHSTRQIRNSTIGGHNK